MPEKHNNTLNLLAAGKWILSGLAAVHGEELTGPAREYVLPKYSGLRDYRDPDPRSKGFIIGKAPTESLLIDSYPSEGYEPGSLLYDEPPTAKLAGRLGGSGLQAAVDPKPYYHIEVIPGSNGEHWAEHRLAASFDSMLAQISFADVLVPMRKSKPIIDQDSFRFVPVRREASGDASSLLAHNIFVPAGIRTTYKDGGKPYLDGPRAIGLVYGDWLVAVGGAQVQKDGKLFVKQLQDVTNVRKGADPEKFAQTGLRNGFWWRDTLVMAWEEIARRLGLTEVAIQSNENNFWPAVKLAGGRGYDDVARRRHYSLEASTGNWVKDISSPRKIR